jgi:hypothetical protein
MDRSSRHGLSPAHSASGRGPGLVQFRVIRAHRCGLNSAAALVPLLGLQYSTVRSRLHEFYQPAHAKSDRNIRHRPNNYHRRSREPTPSEPLPPRAFGVLLLPAAYWLTASLACRGGSDRAASPESIDVTSGFGSLVELVNRAELKCLLGPDRLRKVTSLAHVGQVVEAVG